jgi:hypothetical protein
VRIVLVERSDENRYFVQRWGTTLDRDSWVDVFGPFDSLEEAEEMRDRPSATSGRWRIVEDVRYVVLKSERDLDKENHGDQ